MDLTALAAAFGAAVGALATAVGAGVGAWALWRRLTHQVQQEADASALSHFEAVIAHLNDEIARQGEQADRCDEHLSRQQVHIHEQGDALEQMRREHAICREQISVLRGYVERLYDAARRAAKAARKDPADPDVLPPLPRWPEDDRAQAEFRARTLAQNTQNLTELSEGVVPPSPDPPEEG